MQEVELKPCPFCGGKAVIHVNDGVTVGRECKCCLIKFELRSKIVCDSGAYQENKSRDRAGKLTFIKERN